MRLNNYSKHSSCGLNYNPSACPLFSNFEVLTLNVSVSGDRVFKEAVRLKSPTGRALHLNHWAP